MSSIEELRAALLRFRDERDWQQFHTLRNLIVLLTWRRASCLNSPSGAATRKCVASSRNRPAGKRWPTSVPTSCFYLILVADSAGIDLVEAAGTQAARNADRYPVDKCRGSSVKYDRLSNLAFRRCSCRIGGAIIEARSVVLAAAGDAHENDLREVQDGIRNLFNIRQKRRVSPVGSRPAKDSWICRGGVKMLVSHDMDNTLWQWLALNGWRKITVPNDRRRYRRL